MGSILEDNHVVSYEHKVCEDSRREMSVKRGKSMKMRAGERRQSIYWHKV